MGPLNDVQLVLVFKAEDNEISLPLADDKKFASFSSDVHGGELLMRFISVGNSLEMLVPQFHRLIQTRRQELGLVDIGNARDLVLVGAGALELALPHNDVLVDLGLHGLLPGRFGFLFGCLHFAFKF